ncbi:hypothetical protein FHT87_005228 [Rhizobium sp. BK316]|uniref:hypothetical protein n=1 Tax=Rhizobium sp. BK316 TaxID=2587053 RepID=UPI00160BD29A|nr:hypothetical protein [Rhizobium sp. BK316]MBB3411275.1 hypothetical protein [Rhizobium sp. BK316]
MTNAVTPAGWNDPATAPKNGTMLHLLILPGQEELDAFTSFHDSRDPYETIGFNQLSDTTVDEWRFAGWDWCHDCITDGHGEVIGWLPFGKTPSPKTNVRATDSFGNDLIERELVSIVLRMSRHLQAVETPAAKKLNDGALDYLRRKGLMPSPLRADETVVQSATEGSGDA